MNAYFLGQAAWSYANLAFVAVWKMFDSLLINSGMKVIYLVIVLFAIAFRLLAAPLVGIGLTVGSDMYRKGMFKPKEYGTGISRIY